MYVHAQSCHARTKPESAITGGSGHENYRELPVFVCRNESFIDTEMTTWGETAGRTFLLIGEFSEFLQAIVSLSVDIHVTELFL